MGITIYCDQLNGQEFPENLNTDICSITAFKWKVTAIACAALFAVCIYLLRKWRFRCHKTLLTFHNIRAAVALLLLSINTLELARAYLPRATLVSNGGNAQRKEEEGSEYNLPYPLSSAVNDVVVVVADGQQHETEVLSDHVTVVIGNALIWNALTAIAFTLALMCYHRIVELKKIVDFLYLCSTLEVIVFMLRTYELAEITYEHSIFELEPSLQASTALCLLTLAIFDGLTVYKERYRPDYLEDYEKIGYRHTLATFYSKICFWWLNPLLWFGYKEPLEIEDLGQMRVEDSARAHYDRFLLIYKTTKVKNNDRPPSLWICYIKFCWRMFTLGGVLKLFGDLFALIGPLAIQQIVQYIEIMYGLRFSEIIGSNRNSSNHTDNSNNSSNNNGNSNSNSNSNGKSNNNNSSITLKGLKDQLYSSLRSGSHSLLLYMVSNANKNMIGYESGTRAGGISIRATGTNWFEKSPTDDYYYDYGDGDGDDADDDVLAGGGGSSSDSNADVDSLSSNATDTDVKIYYPTWLDLLSNGWAIAWIVLLAALAQGALSQASTHILNMTGIRIKTSLQGLIYRKTLLLNASCIDASNDTSMNMNENCKNTDTKGNSHEKSIDAENKENISADNGNPEVANNQNKEFDGGSRNVGAITNLMSEDTLNIMSFFWIAHYVWAIPLKIAIVMYLLYLKLGISAVIGSFVCILTMTPLQFLIGKAMSNNTETMARFTDERLRRIHETFVGIKLIKLNAWDDVFLHKIGEARAKELKYLNKDSIYWTLMTILTHISTVLITFVTLAVYTSLERDGSNFTASHLFSALALFQQLTVPLLIFPITVPIIISAVISTKRLERFLYAREIQKQFEGIRNMARILSKSDASLDMYEVKDKSASLPASITGITVNAAAADAVTVTATVGMNSGDVQHQNKLNERIALKINVPGAPAPLAHSEPQTPLSLFESTVGFNFQPSHDDSNKSLQSVDTPYKWHEPREKRLSVQRRELLRNTPYVVIRPRKVGHNLAHMAHASLTKKYSDSLTHREALLLKMPDDMAVSVKQATFAWNPQRMEHVLHIKDIAIPKGRLTIIVGKNDSGKSSLLAAMLMEMPLISGDMIWNKTSTIAFVPQQPWLLNASIRENILFGESFRPKRYDFVLEACALKPDIELMPESDQTIIGERGINLSGGQRQRIAIARALYSSANVVIMDDPLSSLDNAVARHIFEQSIKKMLLKANRTVLLVTQQLQLVQQADYLIVMKDGCLQVSGTYKEIEMNYPHIITKWNSIIAKANEQQKREQQNENNQLGRTARERWKLFKNVTRIGLQRSISASAATTVRFSTEIGVGGTPFNRLNETAGATICSVDDEDDDLLPAQSSNTRNPLRNSQSLDNFTFTRTRSSVYGSRHLIYDVPLPIDECQTEDVIMRRNRRSHSQRLRRQESQQQQQQQQQHSQQQQQPQNQQCPDSLRTSWNSSRFSGLSNASAEIRCSLLTASCSSATSCDSNNSQSTVSCLTALDGINGEHQPNTHQHYQEHQEQRHQRVQSWQPQSSPIHAPVTRNTSLPSSLLTKASKNDRIVGNNIPESFENFDVASKTPPPSSSSSSNADLVADLVKSSKGDGGFQQFLRRMSNRRLYKSTAASVHRIHRPVSATNSILSISEEASTSPTTPITSTPAAAAELIIEADVLTPEKEFDNELQTESHSLDSYIGNNQTEPEPVLNAQVMDATAGDNKLLANKAHTIGVLDMSETFARPKDLTPEVDSTKVINVCEYMEKEKEPEQKGTVQTISTTMPSSVSTTTTTTPSLQPHTPLLQHQSSSSDAERKYGKISAQIYLLYLRASGLPIVLIFFISALIWQCLRVYTDVWLQHWTDDTSNVTETATVVVVPLSNVSTLSGMTTKSQHEVTYYFRVYAIISCVCILMAMISTPAGQLAGCNARRQLHDKLLETIMRKSLHFFQVTPLGRIMNRFTYDMAIIDKKIAATSQRLLQFTLLCLCAVLINVSITPWFILLTLPICGAYYAIQKFYRCSSRELQRIENATNSPVISHLSETIQGVTTIRAYNQEARFTEILFKRLEANTIAFTILNTSNRWLGISLDYLGGVIVFVAIVTALVVANISNDIGSNSKTNFSPTPSPSLVGLAINYTLLIPIYLNWVVKLLADMEMYIGSVERIAYYADPKVMKRDEAAEIKKCSLQQLGTNNDDDYVHKDNNDNDENVDYVDTAVANVPLRRPATFTTTTTRTANDHIENEEEVYKSSNDDAAVAHNKLSNARGTQANIADATNFPTTSTQNLADVDESICDTQQKRSNAGHDNEDKITPTASLAAALSIMERNEAERRASIQRISTTGKRYKTVPISWPQRGDISFENVSLRYEGQRENVIKNLTLRIPAGQRIGICGRTGSGKSSLALSLFGVLQTTSGRICIDDVDIAQIHPDEIRTRLSIIPQDVHLFSATIRENLDPPGYYSDLALWNCLEMAQLKEFVNGQLPQGLDTEITDGGRNLSAGHRQLFCLARAILRGSVCLVLDEATSSLDSSTEKALLTAAHKAFQGRTIITIAHRLSTILDYDRIIVLEQGKIVEDGKPQELQNKPNGVFNALLHCGRPLSATLSESGVVLQELMQHAV